MLVGSDARWQVHRRFGITGGVALSLVQHNGLSALALGAMRACSISATSGLRPAFGMSNGMTGRPGKTGRSAW